jgi:putative membrane protein insertion efficiency factor
MMRATPNSGLRTGWRFASTVMSGLITGVSAAVAAVLIFLIRAYQSVHVAFFRGSCRFHPTCSHYALEAIQLHGPGRGSLLAAWRIVRCQPFCKGGFDPVPEPRTRPDARDVSHPASTSFSGSGESVSHAAHRAPSPQVNF